MCFNSVAAVFVITRGKWIYTFWTNFLEDFFICFTTLSQKLFGLISCVIFLKEFISLRMVVIEMRKRQFLSYHNNGCYEKKSFFKNLDFVDLNCHCKNWLDWINAGSEKISQSKKCKFLEKGRES